MVVANSGPEALNLALKHLPEIALADIGMPGMDGFELARRMRACPELKDTVLVAVTGYGQPEDVKECRAAGFAGHLLKPIDLEMLRPVLRRICRKP